MALTRQIFTAANTEEFAEALRTALDNTGLFDSVTRSTLVVTGTKDNQAILTVDTGTWDSVIVFKNKNGDTLNTVTWDKSGSTTASYASISTDGTFVHCILTNAFSGSGSSNVATHAIMFGVFDTKNSDIGFVYTKSYYGNNQVSPPNYLWISNSSALATDGGAGGGSAIAVPRSYQWGCIESHPLTTLTSDGGADKLEDAYGIICTPSLFTLAKTAIGVTPPIIELDGKQYLTDGILLIEIS